MWSDLLPPVILALVTLIPALATLGLAWITRTTLRVQAAKQAAAIVEFSPAARQGQLSSEQKMELAVAQIVGPSAPLMLRMGEAEATRLVESALPGITKLSDTSQLGPTSLQPSDVSVASMAPPPARKP